MKLDNILLYSGNLATTKDFYTKLGFEVVNESDEQIRFSLGDLTIQCFDQSKTFFQQDSDRHDKGAGVFMYLRVEDVDAHHKRLLEVGLNPSGEPKDWDWGNREFAIKDPDGYRWVFYRES